MTRSPFSAPGAVVWTLALALQAGAQAPSGARSLTDPPRVGPGRTGIVERVLDNGRAGFGYLARRTGPCLSEEQRARIQARVTTSTRRLTGRTLFGATPQPDLRFGWPLRANLAQAGLFGVHGISNFVDHDLTGPDNLLDFECGPRTYDLANGYDHRGTDFFTWPFPWLWMDADAVEVVAVAPGIIVWRSDGHFDENCGFGSGDWNAVYVRHADGTVVWYGHLKKGSVTPKALGQTVERGEYLGVVGSSGNSTGPHLHLEAYDGGGRLIDPFAGPCNSLNTRSRWRDQRPYYDSAINRLMVGDAPVAYSSCPGRSVTHETSVVTRGTLHFFTAFYRDQVAAQVSTFLLRRPSGTVYDTWDHSMTATHYAASWWWWSRSIAPGEETGTWTLEVHYEGRTYVLAFEVV